LGTEQQFLPAGAQRHRPVVDLTQFHLHEGVEEIRGIAVGKNRRQVVVRDVGGDELEVDAEPVLIPQVAEHPQAVQVVVVVDGCQPGISLIGETPAVFATRGEQPMVAARHALEPVEPRKGAVFPGRVDDVEIGLKERQRLGRQVREGVLGQAFAFDSQKPVAHRVITGMPGRRDEVAGRRKHLRTGRTVPPFGPCLKKRGNGEFWQDLG